MPTRKKSDPLIKPLPRQQDETRQLPKTMPDLHRTEMVCPRCNSGRMDYNGLLQLACPQCGIIECTVFT